MIKKKLNKILMPALICLFCPLSYAVEIYFSPFSETSTSKENNEIKLIKEWSRSKKITYIGIPRTSFSLLMVVCKPLLGLGISK